MSEIAQRLRRAANRCVRVNADVTLLCEAALSAADALERQQRRFVEPACPQCGATMDEPIAWLVTNVDGQDAYVTADPTAATAAQRALPLYTTAFGTTLPRGTRNP